MKTIRVKSLRGEYKVVLGQNLIPKTGSLVSPIFEKSSKILIVSQKKISEHIKIAEKSLRQKGYSVWTHIIPDGEIAKSKEELFRILKILLKNGFERRDGIAAIGGGVVGDLSGFAASIYLRGIRYVNIATTLLAQVDSAIGGKTAIDLEEGKNLVGAFYPPSLVISDAGSLKTLPVKQFKAGLGEVVKYAVIKDKGLFEFLKRNSEKISRRDEAVVPQAVSVCAKIKADIVSRDEFETKGERAILNYGHTFAHGIEGALKYGGLVHGEAVAVGMIAASRLSNALGFCSNDFVKEQSALIKNLGLPTDIKKFGLKAETIFKIMATDKKKSQGSLRFILPKRAGDVFIARDIPKEKLFKSLRLAGAA